MVTGHLQAVGGGRTYRQFELDDRAEAFRTPATPDQALDSLVGLLLAIPGDDSTMTWLWCWPPQLALLPAQHNRPRRSN
jgi:hypothetical protein